MTDDMTDMTDMTGVYHIVYETPLKVLRNLKFARVDTKIRFQDM